MSLTDRRKFLQSSLVVATAAALPARVWAADDAVDAATQTAETKGAAEVLELGPAKIKVSRMAVGTGTYGAGHSSNQLRKLGVEGLADLLTHAYEKGVFFWDTSDSYGTHPAIHVALKKVPRDKITILTKTPAVSAANLKADLDRFLKELGTDYIDIVLLHSRMRADWDTYDKPLMDVLSEAKEKKIVRSVGISIHSLDAMKTAAKCQWLEVAMVRLNPAGIRMDAPPDQVLPVMEELKKAGKGIVNIKALGEGQLRNRLDEALTFALHKSPAHCFSLGCESRADFDDNLSRIERLARATPKEGSK
jgi:1-deoxyxylulose-5-phosphate synthase